MAISNDGNIVKRTSQYIDNESFNETTGLRVTEIGGSDGAQVNTAKVNSDGSIDVTVVAGGSAAANYITKIDDTTTTNMIYIGKAALTGSAVATSAAVWQIKRIDTSTLAMDKKWAAGTDAFNQVWDNRATSITYN